MLGLWIFIGLLVAVTGGTLTFLGHADGKPAGLKWGARLLVLSPVWPALLLFYLPRILVASHRAGTWLWKSADLPVPRVLRSKVYDADAGALSEPEFQAGELSTVLPPPSLRPPSDPIAYVQYYLETTPITPIKIVGSGAGLPDLSRREKV